jgi:DNA repair exonuclease SbcCD ATPase subunit
MVSVITHIRTPGVFEDFQHQTEHVSVPDKDDLKQKADRSVVDSISNEINQHKDRSLREFKEIRGQLATLNSSIQTTSDSLSKKEQELIRLIQSAQNLFNTQFGKIYDAVQSGQWREAAFKEITQSITDAESSLDKSLGQVNERLKDIQSERAAIELSKGQIESLVLRITHDTNNAVLVFDNKLQTARQRLSDLSNDLLKATDQIAHVKQYAGNLEALRTEFGSGLLLSKLNFWQRLKWLFTGSISEDDAS